MNNSNFQKITFFLALITVSAPAYAETTSLSRLIGLGQSVQCAYQTTDENGAQSGTFYLANQKMRGEIQVTSREGTYPMNMLNDGTWQYMWGGPMGDNQGMKISTAAARSGHAPGGHQGPDVNKEMDYQCKPWSTDASKFELPRNVQFMEMGSIMPPGMADAMSQNMADTGNADAGGIDMHAIQCGACAQAPAEEQEQCRQVLGC